jgi:transcriptional regulator with XRE-family HTH domain
MPEDDRADRISRFLKAELKRRNISYEELARRLNGSGGQETKASIANKLSRGQFSAIFFIDTLRAIGIEKVDLGDI